MPQKGGDKPQGGRGRGAPRGGRASQRGGRGNRKGKGATRPPTPNGDGSAAAGSDNASASSGSSASRTQGTARTKRGGKSGGRDTGKAKREGKRSAASSESSRGEQGSKSVAATPREQGSKPVAATPKEDSGDEPVVVTLRNSASLIKGKRRATWRVSRQVTKVQADYISAQLAGFGNDGSWSISEPESDSGKMPHDHVALHEVRLFDAVQIRNYICRRFKIPVDQRKTSIVDIGGKISHHMADGAWCMNPVVDARDAFRYQAGTAGCDPSRSCTHVAPDFDPNCQCGVRQHAMAVHVYELSPDDIAAIVVTKSSFVMVFHPFPFVRGHHGPLVGSIRGANNTAVPEHEMRYDSRFTPEGQRIVTVKCGSSTTYEQQPYDWIWNGSADTSFGRLSWEVVYSTADRYVVSFGLVPPNAHVPRWIPISASGFYGSADALPADSQHYEVLRSLRYGREDISATSVAGHLACFRNGEVTPVLIPVALVAQLAASVAYAKRTPLVLRRLLVTANARLNTDTLLSPAERAAAAPYIAAAASVYGLKQENGIARMVANNHGEDAHDLVDNLERMYEPPRLSLWTRFTRTLGRYPEVVPAALSAACILVGVANRDAPWHTRAYVAGGGLAVTAVAIRRMKEDSDDVDLLAGMGLAPGSLLSAIAPVAFKTAIVAGLFAAAGYIWRRGRMHRAPVGPVVERPEPVFTSGRLTVYREPFTVPIGTFVSHECYALTSVCPGPTPDGFQAEWAAGSTMTVRGIVPCDETAGPTLIGLDVGSTPVIHKACVHSLIRAIATRQLRQIIAPVQGMWADLFDEMVSRRLVPESIAPLSVEQYIAAAPYSLARKAEVEAAYNRMCAVGLDNRDKRHKVFIKRENANKRADTELHGQLWQSEGYVDSVGVDHDPRIISAVEDPILVMLGMWTRPLAKSLEALYNGAPLSITNGVRAGFGVQSDVVYAYSLTPEEMGTWFAEVYRSDATLVEIDFSRLDASLSQECHEEFIIPYYRLAGMRGDAMAWVEQLTEYEGAARLKDGAQLNAKRPGSLGSGRPDTTVAAGITCGSVHKRAMRLLRESGYCDGHVLYKGDDAAAVIVAPYDVIVGVYTALTRPLGLAIKIRQASDPTDLGFCGGAFFYPREGEDRYDFRVLTGRLLYKLSWCSSPSGFSDPANYLFTLAHGLKQSMECVPVMWSILRGYHLWATKVKSDKGQSPVFDHRLAQRLWREKYYGIIDRKSIECVDDFQPPSDVDYDRFCERYGISVTDVLEVERQIAEIKDFPATINSHVLDIIVARDTTGLECADLFTDPSAQLPFPVRSLVRLPNEGPQPGRIFSRGPQPTTWRGKGPDLRVEGSDIRDPNFTTTVIGGFVQCGSIVSGMVQAATAFFHNLGHNSNVVIDRVMAVPQQMWGVSVGAVAQAVTAFFHALGYYSDMVIDGAATALQQTWGVSAQAITALGRTFDDVVAVPRQTWDAIARAVGTLTLAHNLYRFREWAAESYRLLPVVANRLATTGQAAVDAARQMLASFALPPTVWNGLAQMAVMALLSRGMSWHDIYDTAGAPYLEESLPTLPLRAAVPVVELALHAYSGRNVADYLPTAIMHGVCCALFAFELTNPVFQGWPLAFGLLHLRISVHFMFNAYAVASRRKRQGANGTRPPRPPRPG